jgi:NADPH-dependent 7-cyano-7-deazaguanine reductase QueF
VHIGDKLWTLHNGEVRETVVTHISSHQTRDVVEVITAKGKFKVTADHPLATPHGWMEAKDVSGQQIEWTDPKSLCRERYIPKLGYHFGYANGAMCSDGTVGDRYISLVANEKPFAEPVGSKFTPDKGGRASKVYISDSWYEKHGFWQQDHRTTLHESEWVDVLDVCSCADTRKPYTVYSFTCDPYPTFLVSGHLTHNCEHHLLPFYCDVSIGYIADGKVLGLSKFARIAHQFAHQLQLQERLGQQIADEVSRITGTNDVAVVLKGRHLCMESRGIQTPAVMSSSVMRGAFRDQFETRMEFLRMIED